MKTNNHIKANKAVQLTTSIIIIGLLLFTGCGKSNKTQPNDLSFIPQIQYDTATFSGKIIGMIPGDQGFKSIKFALSKVVTGDRTDHEIPVKKDGTFTFSIPVECICFAPISSDYYTGVICLIPGEETRLEISYDRDQKKQIKLTNSIGFTAEDAMIIDAWPWELPNIGNEVISPEIFSQRIINGIPGILKPIENNSRLSDPAKQMLISEVKLSCIFYKLLDYSRYIKNAYENQRKTDSLPKEFHPQVPDRLYYSFLKYFNLNDPSYLTAGFYPMVLQSLLTNETLAIPAIGETPIDKWLIIVKAILKDNIGSNTGLFYDLLASNAYAKQLNEMKPLSDVQKDNIKSYFTNKSFASILIYQNEKVVQLAAQNREASIFTFDESSGNVMDSIIPKYKGKAVFVDLWATWCAPCLTAMKESESVRKEFENKNVVFVYITDPSSPRKAWEQKISEIHGEHYYLTEKQWSYLNNIYDFTGIPHYLIFDKSGKLKYNYQAFMGVENMRKWIKETLQ
jgi:thiol-disulfide isomerase/thioredoxin